MASVASVRRAGFRLAPPAIRAALAREAGRLGALVLAALGIGLLVALASYSPHDPSLDTATSRAAANLAGPAGAVAADLLVQIFGLAGALPGFALLVWAGRLAWRRPFHPALRISALIFALPCLGAAFAMLASLLALGHAGGNLAGFAVWPTQAGPGGAIGQALATPVLAAGSALLGPFGRVLAGFSVALLALLLSALALGLTLREWRAAGRVLRGLLHLLWRSLRAVTQATLWLNRVASGMQRRPAGYADTQRPPTLADNPDVLTRRSMPPTAAADAGALRPMAGAMIPVPAARPADPARPSGPDRGSDPGPEPGRMRIAAAARARSAARQESLPLIEAGWRFPPISLLKAAPARATSGPSADALQANARLLESVLNDYGVQGQIRDIRPGPVVTLYELEPAPGIRSARVIGLADDIARSLSVMAVRIATVSGRNVIGIEVPNARRETVYLSELLGTEDWTRHPGRLALALGKDIGGESVVADLARMPHLLIAGTTGSGKSVGVNAMILSLLYRLSPDQCKLILIDPKMLELSVYNGIPHLLAEVVTEPKKAVQALKWTVREMERRYRTMSQLSVRNIGGYNDRVADARAKGEVVTRRVQTGFDAETHRPTFEDQPLALEPLPLIVVVIDEMADLMMVAGKEIEAAVQRLAQMARAAGIHVVMATQRPSVDVITGTIKANFPTRISFQVISKFDSRTILGEQGAEQLLGQGDLLYMQGGGKITRVHGPFVSDQEVEEVVAFLRAQGEPAYDDAVTEGADEEAEEGAAAFSGIAGASEGEKTLFDQAVALVAREGKASTSFIQRHLQIGYNRAARLIEQMEKEGIVTPANHVGKRDILVRRTGQEED